MFKIQSNMKILAETNGLDHLPWMEVKSEWMLQPIGKSILSFTRVNIYYMKIQVRQITGWKCKLVVNSKFYQIYITILYFQDLICNFKYWCTSEKILEPLEDFFTSRCPFKLYPYCNLTYHIRLPIIHTKTYIHNRHKRQEQVDRITYYISMRGFIQYKELNRVPIWLNNLIYMITK